MLKQAGFLLLLIIINIARSFAAKHSDNSFEEMLLYKEEKIVEQDSFTALLNTMETWGNRRIKELTQLRSHR